MKEECKQHEYVFLETSNIGTTECWIFYCKRCLDVKMKAKRLRLDDIFIGSKTYTAAYTAIPLSMELEGTYGAVLKYLSSIEKIELPFLVRDMKLTDGKGTRSGTVKGTLKINIYLGYSKPHSTKKKVEKVK